MLRPIYKVEVGSFTFEPTSLSKGEMTDIAVNLSLDLPSSSFKGSVALPSADSNLEIKKGDTVKVSLGYKGEGSLVQVYKGQVDTAIKQFKEMQVGALDSAYKLLQLKINKGFEQQTAGQIVKALAGEANTTTKNVSDGIKFPSYTIEEGENGYDNIKTLANMCAFDVYFNSDDQLVFEKYKESSTPHSLEYAKNIISINRLEQRRLPTSFKVVGESSSQGAEKAHWLSKKPAVEATAESSGDSEGGGGSSSKGHEELIQNRAIRDKDVAQKVAEAYAYWAKQSIILTVQIVGDPAIKLADTIQVKKAPNDNLNGKYQVRSIEHKLNKPSGFITTLTCRGEKK